MDSFPLVSILMPAKNAAEFLPACLDSILAQSYTSWELLVVDDNSIDQTLNILHDYSKKDSRVKFFNNEGQGIIPALRLAFSFSRGKYITRMDADDLMPTEKLLLLVDACHHENHLATGMVSYFNDRGLGDGYRKYATWLNENIQSPDPFAAIFKECVIPSPCWMLYRTTLQRIGAFDSDTYPEDYDLCFRMRSHDLQIKAVGEVMHYWRDHPNRSSRTDEHYSDNRFLELKLHYFLEEDYNNEIPLALWGAGKKGKKIAQILGNAKVRFHWLTGNANKIGHEIYGVKVEGESMLQSADRMQVIIAIASVEAQSYVREVVARNSGVKGVWFC